MVRPMEVEEAIDYNKLIEAIRLCGSTPKVDQRKRCAYWAGGDMSKCIPRMTEDAAAAIEMIVPITVTMDG